MESETRNHHHRRRRRHRVTEFSGPSSCFPFCPCIPIDLANGRATDHPDYRHPDEEAARFVYQRDSTIGAAMNVCRSLFYGSRAASFVRENLNSTGRHDGSCVLFLHREKNANRPYIYCYCAIINNIGANLTVCAERGSMTISKWNPLVGENSNNNKKKTHREPTVLIADRLRAKFSINALFFFF